ncbi:MAG TPA: hypothetical protein VNM38_00105 [Solirubrobacterales bacterium]|nr:hypothetical protein [Solirubrobacterales bacterium]
MTKFQQMVLGLVAAAVVLAGCGGGGDSTESTSTNASLSKAEYLKRGNQMCKDGYRNLHKAVLSLGENPAETNEEKQQFVLGMVLPPYQQLVDQLSSLSAPTQDKAKVQAFLNSYRKEIEALEADPAQGLSGQPIFAEPQQLAEEYGLTACQY